MSVLTHLLAFTGGGILGIVLMCLCITAKRSDRDDD